MATFSTIVSNELEEVHMIAGDDKIFVYTVYDDGGALVNLASTNPIVYIFRYGDTTNISCSIVGVVTPLPTIGEFTANFPSSSSINLDGVYQQQIKITDTSGTVHRPSQGKIVIFPSAT